MAADTAAVIAAYDPYTTAAPAIIPETAPMAAPAAPALPRTASSDTLTRDLAPASVRNPALSFLICPSRPSPNSAVVLYAVRRRPAAVMAEFIEPVLPTVSLRALCADAALCATSATDSYASVARLPKSRMGVRAFCVDFSRVLTLSAAFAADEESTVSWILLD